MRTVALAKELGIKHIKVVANKVRNDDDMEAIRISVNVTIWTLSEPFRLMRRWLKQSVRNCSI